MRPHRVRRWRAEAEHVALTRPNAVATLGLVGVALLYAIGRRPSVPAGVLWVTGLAAILLPAARLLTMRAGGRRAGAVGALVVSVAMGVVATVRPAARAGGPALTGCELAAAGLWVTSAVPCLQYRGQQVAAIVAGGIRANARRMGRAVVFLLGLELGLFGAPLMMLSWGATASVGAMVVGGVRAMTTAPPPAPVKPIEDPEPGASQPGENAVGAGTPDRGTGSSSRSPTTTVPPGSPTRTSAGRAPLDGGAQKFVLTDSEAACGLVVVRADGSRTDRLDPRMSAYIANVAMQIGRPFWVVGGDSTKEGSITYTIGFFDRPIRLVVTEAGAGPMRGEIVAVPIEASGSSTTTTPTTTTSPPRTATSSTTPSTTTTSTTTTTTLPPRTTASSTTTSSPPTTTTTTTPVTTTTTPGPAMPSLASSTSTSTTAVRTSALVASEAPMTCDELAALLQPLVDQARPLPIPSA